MFISESVSASSDSPILGLPYGATLLDVFEKAALAHPEQGVFLCNHEHFFSYSALWRDGSAFAAGLRAKGIKKGQPLIVTVDETRSFLTALWGGIMAGNIVVPIPPLVKGKGETTAASRLRGIWEALLASFPVPPVLLCGGAEQEKMLREAMPGQPSALQVSGLLEYGLNTEPDFGALPDDVAIIQFSSGSTGQPKGVLLTHGKIVRNLSMLQQGIGYGPDDRLLSWFPYYHDFGLFGGHLLPVLHGAGEFRLPTEDFGRSPENYLALLDKHRITHTYLTPTGAELLLRSLDRAKKHGRRFDLSALRCISLGAEMIPPKICSELRGKLAPYGLDPAAITPGYGLAEACLAVSCKAASELSRNWTVARTPLLETGTIVPVSRNAQTQQGETLSFTSSGKPLSGMHWRITDDEGKTLPPMHLGHLQLQSPCLTLGYCTKGGTDTSLWKGEWMDTGDIGFLSPENEFVPVARKKDVIVVNGRNLYSYDIEQMALSLGEGQLRSAVAAGTVSPDTGKESALLFLVFMKHPGETPEQTSERMRQTAHTIRIGLAQECDLAVNRFFHIRQSDIPLTTSGKVMRHELARRFALGEYSECEIVIDDAAAGLPMPLGNAPQDLAASLRDVWNDVLERPATEALDGKADFFAFGGDSMRAAQLAARLECLTGRKLPTNFAYRYPTYQDQLEKLASHGTIERPATDLEVLIRDILADNADVEADLLSVGKPFVELTPRMDVILKFVQEIRQVFGDGEITEAALAANSIREMAAKLEPLAPKPGDPTPLMPFQETLYFHSQGSMRNEPTGLSCYIMVRLHMVGKLDIPLFEHLLNDVLSRHPLLGTLLDDKGLVPCLRPAPEFPRIAIEVEDLSHLDGKSIETRIRQAENALIDWRWDLHKAPLFCLRFLKTAQDSWELLFHADHMVIDGYSAVVLFMELLHVYDAALAGEPLPKVYEERPFSWYAWLSACREKTNRCKRDMEWHLEDFTPPPPRCAMPMKRNPGMVGDVTFRTYHSPTQADMLAGLREVIAGDPSVSVNSILLAGLFKLVNVWTAENDLIINLPLLNREHFLPASRNVVGSFIDLLPLRLRTSFSEPILTMARRLEKIMREKLERPVSSIALSREIARRSGLQGSMSSIIFSNSISLMRAEYLHHETYDIADMPYVFTGAPGTTIDVLFHSAGGEWRIVWNYMQDLFDESFIATLAAQYDSLLRDAVEAWKSGEPERPFTSQAALPPEHAALLSRINATERPFRAEPLHRFMHEHALVRPHDEALTFKGVSLTYREFDGRSSRMARLFKDCGIGRGQFVALALPRSSDLLLAQFAAFKAGAAYVPVDPAYPADRIHYMIDDSQARLLVTTSGTLRTLDLKECSGVTHVLVLDEEGAAINDNEFLIQNKDTAPALLSRKDIDLCPELHEQGGGEGPDKDDPAYMIYTSGSTGKPKGVIVSHANFCNFIDYVLRTFARGEGERFALVTSPSFDMTLTSNLGALMSGASLHILSEEDTRDVQTLLRFLEEKSISLLNITPSHFSMLTSVLPLMDTPPQLYPRMRILLGGEVVNPADVTQWMALYPGHQVVNEYGPTEATVAVSFFPIPTEAGVCNLDIIPIGKPMQNTRYYILNEEMQPCMLGVPGRLFIGGANVAQGYWRKEEKTAQVFVPDVFARAEGQGDAMMYDTGDMARWLEDGNVQFLGRNDRQVNLRGYRIELGEIENFMLTVPGISGASVVVQSDHGGEKHLCAFYTLSETAEDVPAQTVRQALGELLPEYMVPRFYKRLEAMPLTPSGKLDIKQLPYIVTSERPASAVAFEPPSTAEEEAIAKVWAEIFNLESIGVNDDFWELGGNSIRATRLLVSLHEAGFRLGLRELFSRPTVRGLAACLTPETSPSAPGVSETPCGGRPPRSNWILLRHSPNEERVLLCLPYAGGSPAMFTDFAAALPANVAIHSALYPGVGDGAPVSDVNAIARGLYETLPAGKEFILFGYCFGAYVAHALAKLLRGDQSRRIASVIVTGATPPGAQKKAYDRTAFSAQFTDPQSQEYLQKIYAPLLRNLPERERERYWHNYRAAIEALADYAFGEQPMDIPCHVLTGEQEEYPFILEYAESWGQAFQRCHLYKVPGGHMLLQTHLDGLLKTFGPILESYVPYGMGKEKVA